MSVKAINPEAAAGRPERTFAWIVFALTFGLLVSDYMSRQVLNAVFPLLKVEWGLNDAALGGLSSIVALMVGLLTLPLSALADRFGRSRSLAVMAALWSVATLACALARNYEEMFAARFAVGVGEAAYGSVGIAVVISVFPQRLRATLTGAFMAGGLLGSVLGVALGGMVASALGWRWAFAAMSGFGLLLAIVYPLVVTEKRLAKLAVSDAPEPARKGLSSLIATPSVIAAYVGSGLQLFVCAAIPAWMPSFLNRYYDLEPGRAAVSAAGFLLIGAVGMLLGGMINDRLCRGRPSNSPLVALAICAGSFVLLTAGFVLPQGAAQLLLIALGLFVAAGVTGPAGAMVANLTDPKAHGSAFAALTLANNLLGLAPGAVVTGFLADRMGGLNHALGVIPVTCLAAAAAFLIATRRYQRDLGGAS